MLKLKWRSLLIKMNAKQICVNALLNGQWSLAMDLWRAGSISLATLIGGICYMPVHGPFKALRNVRGKIVGELCAALIEKDDKKGIEMLACYTIENVDLARVVRKAAGPMLAHMFNKLVAPPHYENMLKAGYFSDLYLVYDVMSAHCIDWAINEADIFIDWVKLVCVVSKQVLLDLMVLAPKGYQVDKNTLHLTLCAAVRDNNVDALEFVLWLANHNNVNLMLASDVYYPLFANMGATTFEWLYKNKLMGRSSRPVINKLWKSGNIYLISELINRNNINVRLLAYIDCGYAADAVCADSSKFKHYWYYTRSKYLLRLIIRKFIGEEREKTLDYWKLLIIKIADMFEHSNDMFKNYLDVVVREINDHKIRCDISVWLCQRFKCDLKCFGTVLDEDLIVHLIKNGCWKCDFISGPTRRAIKMNLIYWANHLTYGVLDCLAEMAPELINPYDFMIVASFKFDSNIVDGLIKYDYFNVVARTDLWKFAHNMGMKVFDVGFDKKENRIKELDFRIWNEYMEAIGIEFVAPEYVKNAVADPKLSTSEEDLIVAAQFGHARVLDWAFNRSGTEIKKIDTIRANAQGDALKFMNSL